MRSPLRREGDAITLKTLYNPGQTQMRLAVRRPLGKSRPGLGGPGPNVSKESA